MTTITSLFSRLVLALTLATGTGAALAAPVTYHVTLDTSAFASTGTGYLDLSFGGLLGSAGAATAVVSNATGAITGTTDVIGVVNGDLTTTASFNSVDYGDLAQLVNLGGMFGFDVLFDFADTGTGIDFSVSLYDTSFTNLLPTNFAAQISLVPGVGATFTTFSPFASVALVDAAAVPEPGQWLLMLSGLLLMGAMVRRRNM